jgi:hypothetical protein
MDRSRAARRFLIAAGTATGLLLAAAALAAVAAGPPLRAARWLPLDRHAHALAYEPSECLRPPSDPQTARLVAIGRAAFRTPLLLGGQAARNGLSCDSCHRNGRGNTDFLFPGLSTAPGTADVTSSVMSSHRGDGVANPVPIPDLSGPAQLLKVSRDPADRALEGFIRGLIVEEFDGPAPTAMTLDGLAAYVRALSPRGCPNQDERPVRLSAFVNDARAAAQAAQVALAAEDPATARLMLASARSALGMIDERYAAPALARDRALLRAADLELAAAQQAVLQREADAALRISAWLSKSPRWVAALQRDEALSLFDSARLAASAAPSSKSP